MKTHALTSLTAGNPPAYLANGLVGLRVNPIPLPRGQALVGGFVGLSPEKTTEEYADAPYPVGADIHRTGVWLSARPDQAEFVSQHYDFSCGELTSRFKFRGAQVEVVTFCSRPQPTLTVQQITVEVDEPGQLVLQAHLDPRGLMGQLGYRCMPRKTQDGVLLWNSRGGLSGVGAAYATEFIGEDLKQHRRNDYGHEADLQLTEYHLDAQPGRRYVLRQYGSLVPSLMHGEPHWQAARHVGYAQWLGFDKLRVENRAAWAELWKSRPLLIGADAHWQDVTDAAYFYLHSSVSPSTPCSVAPYGLSQRTNYSGHVFWDTETFMFPPTLLTAPESARSMMEYRSRCLPAARLNARLNGYRGVQFPCQSGNHGWEVAPFYAGGCGGIKEEHFNLDVAFAMAQFVHATGDDVFSREQAWPVLQGVADWTVSRVTRTPRGYEIHHATGIDEGIDNINNNAETNILAAIVLREAAGLAERLGFARPPAWRAVAERMYVPIDPRTHVILKHDGYEYKGGMCIPETLAAFFPFGYTHSAEVDQATIKFHLDLADTYLGMPMLSALLGVFAARSGDRQLALRFFEEGIVSHVQEPFMQFNEAAKVFTGPYSAFSATGYDVFLTNPAGFLLSLFYGLTGLQLGPGDPQSWLQRPIILPAGWQAIEVERLWARNQPMRLQATHGAPRASLTP